MELTHDPRRRIPEGAELSDVFRAYPVGARELLTFHDLVLRHPAPLTVAERELIAAFVSGINACGYCYGAHRIIAESFGLEESVIRSAISEPDMPRVPARMRPILRFADKLTRAPSSIRAVDRDAVLAAGWTEEALYYVVLTCALFNFMNRVVDGMGIVTSPAIQARQRARHDRAADDPVNLQAYRDYGRKLGLFDAPPDERETARGGAEKPASC